MIKKMKPPPRNICAMVKSRYIGDGHPTFNRNPYNGYINPYYWVDDHPLLYGTIGSLDPSTYIYIHISWSYQFQTIHPHFQQNPCWRSNQSILQVPPRLTNRCPVVAKPQLWPPTPLQSRAWSHESKFSAHESGCTIRCPAGFMMVTIVIVSRGWFHLCTGRIQPTFIGVIIHWS